MSAPVPRSAQLASGLPRWTQKHPSVTARCKADQVFRMRVLSAEPKDRQVCIGMAQAWADNRAWKESQGDVSALRTHIAHLEAELRAGEGETGELRVRLARLESIADAARALLEAFGEVNVSSFDGKEAALDTFEEREGALQEALRALAVGGAA